MSTAKCTDDYYTDYNKPITLSPHSICSMTVPFNYLLKEFIAYFCQGCRDNDAVLVAHQAHIIS